MIVSLLGLVISLFAYLLAFPQPHQRRFDVYAALLALHLLATIAYWLMSFESGMDAFLYYRDPEGFFQKSAFTSGTYLIVHFVQHIRHSLGGSFLDHFLFFQCFGMIAVALIIRCYNEIAESLNTSVPLFAYATVFLPGLHFWTVAIGKDGPMVMAISLSIWASLHIQKRVLWMAFAILLMVLIRPHIAGIVMAAITGALFISKQLSSRARLTLAPVALIALIFVGGRAADKFGVTLDPDSFSNFVETQQGLGDRFGSGADLASQPLPMKMVALLFRPFFIDAEGMMGWAASAENALILAIFGYIAYNWRLLLMLAKNVFYVPFCVVFAGILIVLLSLVNYNIGLGQRQKMMAMPAVLLIFVTLYLYKRYQARASSQVQVQVDATSPTYVPIANTT